MVFELLFGGNNNPQSSVWGLIMDRFYRGVIAGTVGGIIMNIWDLFSYYVLDFADLRYLDWAAVLRWH